MHKIVVINNNNSNNNNNNNNNNHKYDNNKITVDKKLIIKLNWSDIDDKKSIVTHNKFSLVPINF